MFDDVIETTSDVNGQHGCFIDAFDWMTYTAVTMPSTWHYNWFYWVASQRGGGSLRLENAGGGSPVYGRQSQHFNPRWLVKQGYSVAHCQSDEHSIFRV